MLIIGITGGSGCGKSTVGRMLAEKFDAVFIDADEIYHNLLNSSDALMRELKRRFPEAVDVSGRLLRKKLAETVFSDKAALADLNEISHKFVALEIDKLIASAYERNVPYIAIDAIALFESGLDSLCDVTIGVIASRQTRIERIIKRDAIDAMSASARINAQPDNNFYISKCDYIIENDASKQEVEGSVTNIFDIITKGPDING